jgi:hypothetical protein
MVNDRTAVTGKHANCSLSPPVPSRTSRKSADAISRLSQAFNTSGYRFSSTQLSVRGYRFNRGAQNVVLAYTAGYSTIPPGVAQACIELVALRYRERTRIGEVSRSLGGAETVAYAQKDMSDAIKTLLQQYRLVAPIAPVQQAQAATGTDATIISGVL